MAADYPLTRPAPFINSGMTQAANDVGRLRKATEVK
jgi:hypothetical protein